ncbi:amidohydrolase [Diplocarpon rosae]|nr:amidohydrolase [Diplocarpon rosae]
MTLGFVGVGEISPEARKADGTSHAKSNHASPYHTGHRERDETTEAPDARTMAECAAGCAIIDSHIHLYPASEVAQLSWCSATHPLYGQKSLDEYVEAAGPPAALEGFIFLETDRKHDLTLGAEDGRGWAMPLAEVDWVRRISLGTPREGEGHTEEQKKLCRAIIPWAPVPSGGEVLARYVQEVERHAGESFAKIKGFRYLVQDKPRGTMLTPHFIDGLRWLGRAGYVFDLGVDQRRGGRWQLEEAVLMIERAHEGVPEAEKVTVICGKLVRVLGALAATLTDTDGGFPDHLCKPDLSVYHQSDPSFVAWRTAMFRLSRCRKTFMKLSGCFSEMPDALKQAPVDEIFLALQPYLVVILATFGPLRIMFGSDWPVCTIGVDDAWQKWRQVVQRFCALAGLSQAEQIMIWSGTAIQAYGIPEVI